MSGYNQSGGYGFSHHDNDRSCWPDGVAWNNARALERFMHGEKVLARSQSHLYTFINENSAFLRESDCEVGKTWSGGCDWYTLTYLPALSEDERAFRAEAAASA